MDSYKVFFKIKKNNPELPIDNIFIGVSQALADNPKVNVKNFTDLVRAHRDATKEEKQDA